MSRRTRRVEDLLHRELADVIRREVADPRVALASVAGVEVSGDLSRAVVRVSALGSEDDRTEAVAALEHAAGYIRTRLARRLRHMRVTPELVFQLDRGSEHSQRISELLEALHDDEQGP